MYLCVVKEMKNSFHLGGSSACLQSTSTKINKLKQLGLLFVNSRPNDAQYFITSDSCLRVCLLSTIDGEATIAFVRVRLQVTNECKTSS